MPAPYFYYLRRFLASLTDSFFESVLIGLLLLLLSIFTTFFYPISSGYFILVYFILSPWYSIIQLHFWEGKTAGKAIYKLTLTDKKTYRQIGIPRLIFREYFKSIYYKLFFGFVMDFISIIANKDGRLGLDQIFDTKVVTEVFLIQVENSKDGEKLEFFLYADEIPDFETVYLNPPFSAEQQQILNNTLPNLQTILKISFDVLIKNFKRVFVLPATSVLFAVTLIISLYYIQYLYTITIRTAALDSILGFPAAVIICILFAVTIVLIPHMYLRIVLLLNYSKNNFWNLPRLVSQAFWRLIVINIVNSIFLTPFIYSFSYLISKNETVSKFLDLFIVADLRWLYLLLLSLITSFEYSIIDTTKYLYILEPKQTIRKIYYTFINVILNKPLVFFRQFIISFVLSILTYFIAFGLLPVLGSQDLEIYKVVHQNNILFWVITAITGLIFLAFQSLSVVVNYVSAYNMRQVEQKQKIRQKISISNFQTWYNIWLAFSIVAFVFIIIFSTVNRLAEKNKELEQQKENRLTTTSLSNIDIENKYKIYQKEIPKNQSRQAKNSFNQDEYVIVRDLEFKVKDFKLVKNSTFLRIENFCQVQLEVGNNGKYDYEFNSYQFKLKLTNQNVLPDTYSDIRDLNKLKNGSVVKAYDKRNLSLYFDCADYDKKEAALVINSGYVLPTRDETAWEPDIVFNLKPALNEPELQEINSNKDFDLKLIGFKKINEGTTLCKLKVQLTNKTNLPLEINRYSIRLYGKDSGKTKSSVSYSGDDKNISLSSNKPVEQILTFVCDTADSGYFLMADNIVLKATPN